VNIAQLPSVLDVWEHLQFDSMPLVWPYVLRAWAALGFTSDLALRFPGLVLGLLVLAALWILAPQFGCRTPLIALAFVELNFEGTRTVGYIKQYGLGILLNLGFLASVWSCVKSPSRWRWWLALLVGMLGAHTLTITASSSWRRCRGHGGHTQRTRLETDVRAPCHGADHPCFDDDLHGDAHHGGRLVADR